MHVSLLLLMCVARLHRFYITLPSFPTRDLTSLEAHVLGEQTRVMELMPETLQWKTFRTGHPVYADETRPGGIKAVFAVKNGPVFIGEAGNPA